MVNKILKIMEENNEIITPAQLEEKGISRMYLTKMKKEGIIEKIDRGIYVTQNFKYDEYFLFQFKYPKTIFSYNTALYFYEMTERTPDKIDVTVYREYNPHRFKDYVNVHRVSKEFYELGEIEKLTPQGMNVRTYNLERTVCDIINDKRSLEIEIRNKAIKKCIKNKEFNASRMFEYAKKMNIYSQVKNYMEAII